MKIKIFAAVILIVSAQIAKAQSYGADTKFGTTHNRSHTLYALGIPNDTLPVPLDKQGYPHLAVKDTVFYVWSVSLLKWKLLSGTASTYTASNGITLTGTAFGLGGSLNGSTTITNASGHLFRLYLDEDDDETGLLGNNYGGLIGFKNGEMVTRVNNSGLKSNLSSMLFSENKPHGSYIEVYTDSILIQPRLGKIKVDSLQNSPGTKSLRYNPSTGLVSYSDTTIGGGSYADSLRRVGLNVQMRKNGNWTTQFNLPDSTGGSSLAFTNGLTESGGTVKSGGIISEDTKFYIDNGYNINFDLDHGAESFSITNDGSDTAFIIRDHLNIFFPNIPTSSSITGRKVLVHDTATGKVERVDQSVLGGWGLTGNTVTAGTNYIGTNNNASFRIHTNNTLTAWFDSLQGRLHLVNGTDPLVSMKQATTNQTWQMRVGAGTGLSNSTFNIYDATANKIRMIINQGGDVAIGNVTSIPNVSQLYVYGGGTGANIDARGDSTSEARDEANIEVEHPDYDGVSHNANGVAMQTNGNVTTGSLLTYPKKNSGQLRFTNETNIIRVINNRSLRFATNNIERAVLDSNGRLGIGIKLPDSLVHIKGGLRIENGTQGAGKVLTSDANGGASWQTPASVADTSYTTIATFTAGGGFASDTIMCTDSTLFGSFYTGQFDYTIAYVQAVIKGNAGDSIVLKLVYNDTFNVDGTKVNGAGLSINNRYTGNYIQITANRTVPAGTWLWMKPESIITGKKPKYISVTLVGYKTYATP